MHVIARSEATGQSVPLAAQHYKKEHPGQIRSASRIRPNRRNLAGRPAGMRIATPVCALARNDMLKTERFLRVKCAVFMMKNVLANVDALQVIACHCEERSDGAIRSPCSTALQKGAPRANSQPPTNSPKRQATCQVFPRGSGLPRREAAAPLLAMTCRRQRRFCGCKKVVSNDMQKAEL